jgi:hypothetical protein
VRLLGYGLTLAGQDAERTSFAGGDQAQLTLFWQAGQQSSSDAQLSLELQPSSAPAVPLFSGAVTASHPTSTWASGDRYREQHRLTLPAGLRGEYDLMLRIDGEGPVRLAGLTLR